MTCPWLMFGLVAACAFTLIGWWKWGDLPVTAVTVVVIGANVTTTLASVLMLHVGFHGRLIALYQGNLSKLLSNSSTATMMSGGLLFLADMFRLAATVLLPYKLHMSRSAAGVSLKMQQLYLLVFSTRYCGIVAHYHHYSLFSRVIGATSVMSVIPTAVTVGMLKYRPCLKASYDASLDRFRLWMHGIVPSFVLAVIVHTWQGLTQSYYHPDAVHFAWIFSEMLEPLAVVPQLLVSRGRTDAGRPVWTYLILMGVYRPLCVLSWVYRANHDRYFRHHPLLYATGIVQTAMYLMFLVDRRVRVSPHLPPHETGDVDIMEPTSSARKRLLPDEDTDTDSRRNRDRGLDGEVHVEISREFV